MFHERHDFSCLIAGIVSGSERICNRVRPRGELRHARVRMRIMKLS